MCELMSIAATVVFAAHAAATKSKASFAAALMFGGASLMWLVDCIGSYREGEAFFDLSSKDALLGAIVLAAGTLAWSLMKRREA